MKNIPEDEQFAQTLISLFVKQAEDINEEVGQNQSDKKELVN